MTPRVRKLVFTAHVTFSVRWLGAVVAYLALAIAGLAGKDAQMARAAYLSMELIGWYVIVPLCFAALAAGLVQSLGTEWGLFQHYWIVAKFLMTIGATIVLLLHMPAVSRMSGIAATTTLSGAFLVGPRTQLVVHAAGGLLVLVAATILSVYKPWGMTPYGRRKASPPNSCEASSAANIHLSWKLYLLLGIIGLFLLFVVLHLAGGGMRRH